MKVITIVAVTLTFQGVSFAGDDKNDKIMKMWECFTCHEDPTLLEEYIKCKALKPERGKQMVLDCIDKILPGIDSIYDRWPIYCKNENDENQRFEDCLMSHEYAKILDEDEKSKMKEYEKCSDRITEKYCGSYM